jgi:ribonuclease D
MNIIIKQQDLDEVVRKIDANGRFAMDLEFIPERSFHPILCLVQIATDHETFIIDPLRIPDLSQIWIRAADPAVQKVLHAAVQDLDLIFKLSNLLPSNVFDTQIAAGFAGFGFPAGYGKLLQQVLGITIAKSESYTDWLERPLSPSQIEYAKEDVCHLLPMADKLRERLTQQGRLDWALEECRHYSEIEQYVRAKKQEFTRVKGANGLNRRALAVLQSLCEFRDAEAERVDRPARSILSDTTLIELSRRPPATVNDIYRIRGIRQDQVKSFGKRLIEQVEAGLALPAEACPVWPSARAIAKRDALVGDMLYAVLKVIAYQADIATELLATRDDVQYLVRLVKEEKLEKTDFPLLKGWRSEMAGRTLCDLIQQNNLRLHFDLDADPPIKLEFDTNTVGQGSER